MELFFENSEKLKVVNYFRKKTPSYIFERVLMNTPPQLVFFFFFFMHCNQKYMKISHTSNNLFKYFSANPFTWNISMIPNSLIKKGSLDETFFNIFPTNSSLLPSTCLFWLKIFSLYQKTKSFFYFHKSSCCSFLSYMSHWILIDWQIFQCKNFWFVRLNLR